jgi:hypothetical protein
MPRQIKGLKSHALNQGKVKGVRIAEKNTPTFSMRSKSHMKPFNNLLPKIFSFKYDLSNASNYAYRHAKQ